MQKAHRNEISVSPIDAHFDVNAEACALKIV